MKSGIKFRFCMNTIFYGGLNDKPITIPFVFHFSCVKFYVVSLVLPIPITNPNERNYNFCRKNSNESRAKRNAEKGKRSEKKNNSGFNHIDVKYLRKLSCLLWKRFIALMHNSASSMRQCANWMVKHQPKEERNKERKKKKPSDPSSSLFSAILSQNQTAM